MSKQDELTLECPVIVDGTTYERLTFRKMKARDLMAADLVSGQLRKSMAIFAAITDVQLAVIEELDADDFEAVGVKAAQYMGKRGKAAAAEAKAKAAAEVVGEETLQ